jgi:hypothetical protein
MAPIEVGEGSASPVLSAAFAAIVIVALLGALYDLGNLLR